MKTLVRAMGWVIVGVFTITFLVTILTLFGKLTIAEPYLKGLFGSLVLELVSAFFLGALKDFNEARRRLEQLKTVVGKQDGIDPSKVSVESIEHKLGELEQLKTAVRQLDGMGLRKVTVESIERRLSGLEQLKTVVGKLDGIASNKVSVESIERKLLEPLPCKECSRSYAAIIYWDPEYAKTLFNYMDRTPNFQAVDPRSVGDLHFYKTQSGCFKGFSTWETKNGEQTYSQVVVTHGEFIFESPGRLKEISTNIVVRNKLVEFSYGPFTHYRIRFSDWSDTVLRGKMLLIQNGNGAEELEVGDIVLELH